MAACENLEGKTLTGQRSGKLWSVKEKLTQVPDLTPGAFSVGYIVENEDNTRAFMKASDLGMFVRSADSALEAMQQALNAHAFERKILDHCQGNRMDRVVTALDYGDEDITHHGTRDRVFFLIFEMATGDLRKHVVKTSAFDFLWALNSLHNFFVGVNQLHTATVAHNDLKPANTLIFDKDTQKIADLGRATSRLFPIQHDAFLCAGDVRFAPPEQLYPTERDRVSLSLEQHRVAGDLYNLGSLIYYVITARMLTPEIIAELRPEMRPRNRSGGSQDSFEQALPYWRNTFSELVKSLKEDAQIQFGPGVEHECDKLIEMTLNLCDPDPMLRGHPKNRTGTQNVFGLERYISELDYLRKRLAIKSV